MRKVKKVKAIFLSILCLVLSVSFAGCKAKDVKGSPQFGAKEFLITNFSSPMGEHVYNGVTYANGITEENYKIMKESGIDTVLALWNDAVPAGDITQEAFLQTNTYKALEAAKANGMKYYVMDLQLRAMARSANVTDAKLNKISERLELYKNHEAFGGIHLDDEPSATHFYSIEKVRSKIMDVLGEGGDIFLNLFGSRASTAQLSGSAAKPMTYTEHISQFSKKTNFSRISYDNYPFYYNADDVNTDMVMWFENLETVSEFASPAKPMNVCIQSCNMDPSRGANGEDFTNSNYYAQIRSQKDISFQTYTAMAYGAQQFTYFTYWTPSDAEIVAGMVNLDGSKTEIYDYVLDTNAELRKIQNEYLSFDYLKTVAVPKSGEDLSHMTSMLKENSCSFAQFASSQEVIVGEFSKSSGHSALMISNATEPRFNLTATTTVTFSKRFNKATVIKEGAKSTVEIVDGKLEVEVNSGSGVFVIPYIA